MARGYTPKKDSKAASSVLTAFGEFNSTVQMNLRFFRDKESQRAIYALVDETGQVASCYTTLASVNHDISVEQLNRFRLLIANACRNQNHTNSLMELKRLEAEAIHAMDEERKREMNQIAIFI